MSISQEQALLAVMTAKCIFGYTIAKYFMKPGEPVDPKVHAELLRVLDSATLASEVEATMLKYADDPGSPMTDEQAADTVARKVTSDGRREQARAVVYLDHKAPPGKFKVIGVDTFDGTEWEAETFDRHDLAMAYAKNKTAGKQMLMYYVYNDTGRCVGEAGDF
jgi:hypothetical protein